MPQAQRTLHRWLTSQAVLYSPQLDKLFAQAEKLKDTADLTLALSGRRQPKGTKTVPEHIMDKLSDRGGRAAWYTIYYGQPPTFYMFYGSIQDIEARLEMAVILKR